VRLLYWMIASGRNPKMPFSGSWPKRLNLSEEIGIAPCQTLS
jgi:hypothetical protein